MQTHIDTVKMNFDMSPSTELCTSDDEPTTAQEKDPLLMVPQPPRGRMAAVLAVRPERISYQHQRGLPIAHQASAVMLGKMVLPKRASENGFIVKPFESLKKVETYKKHSITHTKKAVETGRPEQITDLVRTEDRPNGLDNVSPGYRDFSIKTENFKVELSSENSPEEAADGYDEDLDRNSTCNNEVPQIKIEKTKRKKKKKNKLKINYDAQKIEEQACNRPNCEFIGSSRIQLKAHKREVHRNSHNYVCEHCAYTSASAADLRKHFRIHSGDMPYECPHPGCTFKGRHSNSLDYHQKKVHPTGEPLKCDVRGCEYSTHMSISLKNHYIKKHGNGKTIACELCSYRCYLLADLRKHLRTHSGETPYACDWPGCGYACKISSNLRKHKRIHTEERPYACELCAFRSNFISSLKAHKRIHTNERPYCCEQCGYRCNSTSNLKKHILQRHPGTVYSGPLSTGAAIRAARTVVASEHSNIGSTPTTDRKELSSHQPKHKKDNVHCAKLIR